MVTNRRLGEPAEAVAQILRECVHRRSQEAWRSMVLDCPPGFSVYFSPMGRIDYLQTILWPLQCQSWRAVRVFVGPRDPNPKLR